MKDIFSGFQYACEKISENDYSKEAGYESLKRMVSECKAAFEDKFGSVSNVDAVAYHLNEIYELYDLIDNCERYVDGCVRVCVEKHLYQNLMFHIGKLQGCYEEIRNGQ